MNNLTVPEIDKKELIEIIKYLYSKDKRYEELIERLGIQVSRQEEVTFNCGYKQNITHEEFYIPTTHQTFSIGYGNSYLAMEEKIKNILDEE